LLAAVAAAKSAGLSGWCFWPVPLEMSAAAADGPAVQLRLIEDDGYAGPGEAARRSAPLPPALPRRKAVGSPQRPQTTLL
jgi:hypothetical protein